MLSSLKSFLVETAQFSFYLTIFTLICICIFYFLANLENLITHPKKIFIIPFRIIKVSLISVVLFPVFFGGGLILNLMFDSEPEQESEVEYYYDYDQSEAYEYAPNNEETQNPNEDGSHFVRPHERTLPSGETIWVDGDGDTSVDRSIEEGGGWIQGNP